MNARHIEKRLHRKGCSRYLNALSVSFLIELQNLAGLQLGILLQVIQLHDGTDRGATLFSNTEERLATLHLVEARLLLVAGLGSCRSQLHLLAVLVAAEAHAASATQTGGNGRLLLVGGLAEHVVVVDNILIAEVEHQGRVEGHATETRLEVQVGTRAPSGVATKTDGVAGAHFLILFYELLRHVGVVGLQTVVVADDDVLAVATAFVAYDTHLA